MNKTRKQSLKKVQKTKVAPRSTLAIAGKRRPPLKEKLDGTEVPPPEEVANRLKSRP
jgi:hypothetical protein